MTPPGTFERVYGAIRERLRNGLYRPGSRLEPAVLSEELNASVTPVRDALHRLTGERLVEAPRHEGFRVPLITETDLRHLYSWHRDLLGIALIDHSLAPRPLDERDEDPSELERQNGLFFTIARLTGNPEHLLALESLADRLEPAQRLEAGLLDAVEEETEEIAAALKEGDRKRLRRALVHYHRRRARIVPELLDRLYHHSPQ
jgi:DNA-binding GntR family transcriptional regulator